MHTYVQVCACMWSPEDSCAYIRAGVSMHVEPQGQLCIHIAGVHMHVEAKGQQ